MYCDGTCDPLRVQLDVIVIKLISVKKVAGLIIAGLMGLHIWWGLVL